MMLHCCASQRLTKFSCCQPQQMLFPKDLAAWDYWTALLWGRKHCTHIYIYTHTYIYKLCYILYSQSQPISFISYTIILERMMWALQDRVQDYYYLIICWGFWLDLVYLLGFPSLPEVLVSLLSFFCFHMMFFLVGKHYGCLSWRHQL